MPIEAFKSPKIKRIAWIVHTLSSGGIGPVCRYTAQALESNFGFDTVVVALHEAQALTIDCSTGARVQGLGLPQDNCEGFFDWLDEWRPDCVVTNDVATLEPYFDQIPSEILHIVQLHDSGPRYTSVAARNSEYINGIVCVAQYIRDNVSKQCPSRPCTTIHNGATFPPPEVNARSYNDRISLLYTGRMDPLIKGIYDLVPICKALRYSSIPFRLQILGGRHPKLMQLFERSGIAGCVDFLGFVPLHECYSIAAQNDVLIMPSRREPFGMVTIEAMSMGCVPIAWDIEAGTREIVEPNKSGFLIPLGNYRKFAHCIGALHHDRPELARCSQAAVERARNHFSSERVSQEWNCLLESNRWPLAVRLGRHRIENSPQHNQKRNTISARFKLLIRDMIARSPKLSALLLKHVS